MSSPKKQPASTDKAQKTRRQPVVVVMGHIDHGKSTLLDYIRKANTVAGEAGGITQSIGAYEAMVGGDGGDRRITFIDTPGHAAFCDIRERGAAAADIAILIVSAEDGVKPQTVEALQCIRSSKIPFIVAINKIDKPGANIEKTKQTLAENEVYLEGYGGDIPVAEISATIGTGIPELLEMIKLIADLGDLSADPTKVATGSIIEANLDKKKGIAKTLIVKNGTLKKGSFIAAGGAFAPVRILENWSGKTEAEIGPGRPARVVGWNALPAAGETFTVFTSKKEAEEYAEERKKQKAKSKNKFTEIANQNSSVKPTAAESIAEPIKPVTIPLIIKADSAGSLDGIHHELEKIKIDNINIAIISEGLGEINEKDTKVALGDASSLIIGFNVEIDTQAAGVIERSALTVKTFRIIYELTDYVRSIALERKPKEYIDEKLGEAKVLALFGGNRDKQIIGGKVETGAIAKGGEVKVMRRGGEIGRGKIRELQQSKEKADEVREGYEFGAMIADLKVSLAVGDRLEAFHVVEKK
ncbi:MAG: translation initiation factor IF-2 [Patescibacteria group bacterium]|nr:translation initiation factor IF-2 [Patescibacteria group bacterium]